MSGPDDVDMLKSEVAALQFALGLERNRARSVKAVSGSQFKLSQRDNKCLECGLLERSVHKYRESIRTLKVHVVRLEDRYQTLRKTRLVEDDPAHNPRAEEGDHGLQQRCDDYEVEVGRLKKLNKADQHLLDLLRKALEEGRAAADGEMQAMQVDYESALQQLAADKEDQRAMAEQLAMDLSLQKGLLEAAELRVRELLRYVL